MGFPFKNNRFFTHFETGYRLCLHFAFNLWCIYISEAWHSCVGLILKIYQTSIYCILHDIYGKFGSCEITGDEFSDHTGFSLLLFSFMFIFLNMKSWKSLFRIGVGKL